MMERLKRHRREAVVLERADWNTVEACIAHTLVHNRRAKNAKMVARIEDVQQKFRQARKVAENIADMVGDSG